MTQENKTEVPSKKFSKEAFLNATKTTKERLLLEVLLEENKKYTKDQVAKLAEDWNNKEVK
ncbi:MAG: hypothetical protein RR595_06535 [Lysinibacillus sp.]